MNTFKRRIVLVGSMLLVLSALVSLYSYYKLNSIYGLVERNKIFEIPFSQSLAELKTGFDSYRFEVNKIVSAPKSYSSDDIKNSVFKAQTENQINKIQKMSASYEIYSTKVENANKAFKNYVVAAAAIVDAFSSSADMDSQQEENIKRFSEIMKVNESSFTSQLTDLDVQVAKNMVIGTNAIRSYFSSAGFWVWTLFILMAFCFAALFFYVSRVSNFIKAVNTSLEDVRDGHYNTDEISSNIPFASESEFFELADKVTKIASLIHNDMTINKEKIKNMEEEVLRLKAITSYTTSILNSMDHGIMVTDSLLKVSFVNYEFEKFWRVKRNALVDTGIEDLPFMRLVDGWKDALVKGKTCCFKSKYKPSAKEIKNVDLCIMPLMDSSGQQTIGTITLTKTSVN